MNYRNTPHPSTGKTPAELMIRRQIRTRVPVLMKSATEKVDREAKAMDRSVREKRKDMFDSRKHTKTKEVVKGVKVLVKQKKSSIRPPFDPNPYTVTKVKGTQVTASRGAKERTRNQVKMKVLKERPVHLQPQSRRWEQAEDSDNDADIQLGPARLPQQQEEQIRNDPVQQLEPDAGAPGGGEPVHAGQPNTGVRRSGRACKAPERYGDVLREGQSRPSPRDRKRIQSLAARKVPREQWRIRQTSRDNLVIVGVGN